MRKLGYGVLLVAALGGLALAKGGPAPTMMPASDLKWVDLMGAGGPQMAVLWGNPQKGGESGFLLKLPAGMVSAPHIHSNPYWAVTISGTMSHWLPDSQTEADAKPLPANSFAMMPGKVKHISKCAAGADCIIAIRMNGKFDFKAIEDKTAAKPAAEPAAPAPTK